MSTDQAPQPGPAVPADGPMAQVAPAQEAAPVPPVPQAPPGYPPAYQPGAAYPPAGPYPPAVSPAAPGGWPSAAPPPRRRWLPWVIGVAVAIAVAGAGVGVYYGAFAVISAAQGGGLLGPQPLLTGEPGDPVAVAPEDCPSNCIGGMAYSTAKPDHDELTALLGDYERSEDYSGQTTLVEEQEADFETWADRNGTPNTCFFTFVGVPAVLSASGEPTEDGSSLRYDGGWSNSDGSVSVWASFRSFRTSGDAQEHMARLAEAIDGCAWYRMDDWRPTVSAAPAFEVPDSVAVVGWREDYEGARYYVADIHRSDLVVRLSMSSDGTASERGFRRLVESVAARLDAFGR